MSQATSRSLVGSARPDRESNQAVASSTTWLMTAPLNILESPVVGSSTSIR